MTVFWTLVLGSLLGALPLILIGVVGAVLSHTRLQQIAAKAARLASLGFGLIAAQAFLRAIIQAYLLSEQAGGARPVSIASGLTILGVVTSIMLWTALVLLLCSALADRKPAESPRGAN